jgi:hypothetical protein
MKLTKRVGSKLDRKVECVIARSAKTLSLDKVLSIAVATFFVFSVSKNGQR